MAVAHGKPLEVRLKPDTTCGGSDLEEVFLALT